LFSSESERSASIAQYGVEAGQITPVGERHLYDLGDLARKNYVRSGFMPEIYNPQTVLIRAPTDGCAIISGYSYIMGMYPETVEGLDLDNLYGVNDVNVPINAAQVDRVRPGIGSKTPTCGAQRVDVYPGNDDKEFLIKPISVYPQHKTKINENLNTAKKEFEQKYGNDLYLGLSREMSRPESDFNFANSAHYLDEYIVAQENNHETYNSDTNLDELATEYYNYYFKNGLFRDEALTREFTNSYFLNLIQELEMKRNSLDKGNSKVQLIDTLKYSIHIGNHQTYAAILHVLGVSDHYRLDFSQMISWEMFKRSGKYYVRPLHNGVSLELEGNVDDEGEVELGILFEYLCSILYYGDDILEAKGFSSPSDYNDKTLHCLGARSLKSSVHKLALSKSLSDIANNPTTCEIQQEPVRQAPVAYVAPFVQPAPVAYVAPFVQQAPVAYVAPFVQPAPVSQPAPVLQPASILKGLVDSSPTYDSNERTRMNAPRGTETYVEPIDNNNYGGIQGDGRYSGNNQNVRYAGQQSRQAPSSASQTTQYVPPTTQYVPSTQRSQGTRTNTNPQGNIRYGPQAGTQSSQNIRATPNRAESSRPRATQQRSGSSNVISTPQTHQNYDHYQPGTSRSPPVTTQSSPGVTAAPRRAGSSTPTPRRAGSSTPTPRRAESSTPTPRRAGSSAPTSRSAGSSRSTPTARSSAPSGSNTISHHTGGFSSGTQPATTSDGTVRASIGASTPTVHRPGLY
jgi:hypothetical protein